MGLSLAALQATGDCVANEITFDAQSKYLLTVAFIFDIWQFGKTLRTLSFVLIKLRLFAIGCYYSQSVNWLETERYI